jgi:hypothetical protein
MKRPWPVELAFVILAMSPFCICCIPAHAARHQYQQATLVDTGEYDVCHYDCQPFDRPTLYFCVHVGNRILVGSTSTGWIWAYDNSKMLNLRGKSVLVRYNDHSIWIVRTDGKDMRLKQNYSRDVFADSGCSAEIHRHWLQRFQSVSRPDAVPAGSVLIAQSNRSYFWANCVFDSRHNWDLCSAWDSKGTKYKEEECVNSQNHRALLQSDLLIDPLATSTDYQFHLKDGVVLADWAKGRINDKPIPGSLPPLPPLAKQGKPQH